MLALEDVIPIHLADQTFPAEHRFGSLKLAIFAFAIRHPAGLVLFETGIGHDSTLERQYQIDYRPIEDELGQHQLGLGDVKAIINSHLHFDHCGNNPLFPGVPIYVQRDEYHAAQQPNYTVERWVYFPDADYRQIEGDKEIAPGLKILATQGHTPGHQALLVDTTSGPVVLAGQAILSKVEYEYIRDHDELPPQDRTGDSVAYLVSAQRLIRLEARRVYFSHDSAMYEAS